MVISPHLAPSVRDANVIACKHMALAWPAVIDAQSWQVLER